MNISDTIEKMLEKIGYTILDKDYSKIVFKDDTDKLRGGVTVDSNNLKISLALKDGYFYQNILYMKDVPFDNSSYIPVLENILKRHYRLYGISTKCLNSLTMNKKQNSNIDLFEKFSQHFGEGVNYRLNIVGIYADMEISLSNTLELVVTLYEDFENDDFERAVIFNKVITNENYENVFSEVDELIETFRKNVLDTESYVTALKDSAIESLGR